MITNHIIESFLECPYKAYLLFHNEQGKPTEYERLGEELLDMYRADFYAQLHARYDESQLLRGVSFEKKLAITDTTYVLEPVFQSEGVRLRFDALEIALHKELPSKLVYLPIEVIPKEKVSKTDKLALALKCLLLTQTQRRVTPEFGKIVFGRALNSTKVKLAVYAKEARKILKDLTKILQSNEPPRFFQNKNCRTCQFQEACQAKLLEKDDLSLLAGMNPKNVLKQNNRGIFNILQFSYTFRPRRRSKKAANKPLRFEPALKALALREKKTYIQELPKLPETDVEVYLDFEGLPDENFIYLIGLMIKHGDTERQFSLWADTKEGEEDIFVQLFETLPPFDNFTIYHYGSYETQALKRLNRKYDNRYEDEVTWILEKSVNILSFLSSTIYPPTYTNELKDIARFLGFRWTEQAASGIQSIVWRKRWELSHEGEYKKKLIQYNIEDCEALKSVKQWLIHIVQKIEIQEDIAQVEDIQTKSSHPYKFGEFILQLSGFKDIDKYAHFDYQREKIYLKTNRAIRTALKKELKQKHVRNIPNKIIIPPRPEYCLECGHNKLHKFITYRKITVDLKFMTHGIKKWVVRFDAKKFRCCRCRRVFTPENAKHIPKYGRNIAIWSMYQYITYRLSLTQIKAMLLDSFRIQISRTRLGQFKINLATDYHTTFEEIQDIVLHGNVLHVDETQVRVRKFSSSYIWVFTTMDAVFYLFRPNREADFLKKLLKDFHGILVSDFYSGYDSLPCAQQKCLIHLIRDINDDLFTNQFDLEFKTIVTGFAQLLKPIIETVNTYGLKKRRLHKHRKDVETFYRQTIDTEYGSELAVKYQKRFMKYKEKLFTFLDYDGVPWNNNNAEHAIKPFAKYRRDRNGRLFEDRLNDSLTLFSIQQTCKYRGLSFLEFLKSGETSIEAYTRKVLG